MLQPLISRQADTDIRWYALYTCARHEKQVALQLASRDVEYYLPLYHTVRAWSDRRVALQMPLFPGYVFVHITLQQRLLVLRARGAVTLISANGRPVPIPDQEISEIQRAVNSAATVEPHRYLRVGQRVRVCRGPLIGLEGILTRRKSRVRVVVSLELIQRAIAVEVDATEVEPAAVFRQAA